MNTWSLRTRRETSGKRVGLDADIWLFIVLRVGEVEGNGDAMAPEWATRSSRSSQELAVAMCYSVTVRVSAPPLFFLAAPISVIDHGGLGELWHVRSIPVVGVYKAGGFYLVLEGMANGICIFISLPPWRATRGYIRGTSGCNLHLAENSPPSHSQNHG